MQQAVFKRPLPTVGGGDRLLNTEKCRVGRICDNQNCKDFHSDSEKRCLNHMRGMCQPPQGARCTNGLHTEVSAVNLIITVDLGSPIDVAQKMQVLESQHPDENARYVRIVVFGFAAVYEKLLRKMLEAMPLLHEIVLADRAKEPTLLVFLCDVVENCAKSNPRLREAIFEDDTSESLW